MKINIAFTQAGTQKQLDISDELKLRPFYDKRISHEVPADSLGSEWKGYVLKITGGFDKCGTPMMQGVLTNGRVSLLLSKGQKGVKIKRDGVRFRKSVRGCILDSNLSVINAIIVKKGKKEIPGLTDTSIPVRLGPKRADKIRKIFKLSPKDDVRKYVVHRKVVYKDEAKRKSAEEAGKEFRRAPKIQRLVTFQTKRRTHLLLKEKQQRSQKSREQAENYAKLVGKLKHDYKVSHEEHRKRKSSTSSKKPDTKTSALVKDDKKQEAKKKVVSHADSKKTALKQAQVKGKAPEKISTDSKKIEKRKTVETKPAAIRKKIEKAKDTATPKASSSIKFESKSKVKETTAPKSGSNSTKSEAKPKAKQAPAPKASSSIKFETTPKEKSSASQTKPKMASKTKTEAKPSATSTQKPTVKSVEKTKPVKK